MTPNEKLVKYMWAKAALMPGFEDKYFIPADAAAIMAWPEDVAARVVREMIAFLDGAEENIQLLRSRACPFCEKDDMNCDSCEYAVRHGVCGEPEDGNTWGLICASMDEESLSVHARILLAILKGG